jgi:uncharacterized protein YcfJ
MKRTLFVVGFGLLAGGCATPPLAPDVTVMPAYGKPFEVFAQDDAICRQFAADRVGVSSQRQATASVVESGAAGAAIGAASGALMGHGHDDAATGAGAGLVVGTAVGSRAAGVSTATLQRRYDIAYQQCMYAKGNLVPGFAAPGSYVQPPPPAGYQPPPPPPAAAPR